jgi:ankyrin repeat protein
MLCALEGKTEIARLLLENGAKVNQTNRARVTALFPACMNGHLEMVKLLVSYGANVNQVDVDGRTPLFNAVWSDAACVKFLIDHGAQINVINRWGRSPLFHLCGTPGPSERANEIGKILIENGARLDLRDREFSIYSLAKLHGHEGILKMLEERGVRE